MKKEQRILKNHEFSKLIARRKTIKGPAFLIYYQPKAQANARFGLSVSKKLGNAVVRNRIKRQLRAMADQVFDFHGPVDVIVIVRKPFLEQDFDQNLRQLESLLARIRPAKQQKGK